MHHLQLTMQAIARFNPSNKKSTDSESSDEEPEMDCEDVLEDNRMRAESRQLVMEVLDRHFTRQHEILAQTIAEDRALAARMRTTGSLNPDNFSGFDASSEANIGRLKTRGWW